MVQSKQELQHLQVQKLVLSPQMQQSLRILQLPITELTCLITEEIERNPVFEPDSPPAPMLPTKPGGNANQESDDIKDFIENTIASESSLFEFLQEQIRDLFVKAEELHIAEILVGNLDERGWLTTPMDELEILCSSSAESILSVLYRLQTCEPTGIGARSLQEALQLQLSKTHAPDALARRMVNESFDDVVKNRVNYLSKRFSVSTEEVYRVLTEEIATLEVHPGKSFLRGHYRANPHEVIPDIRIDWVDHRVHIEINRDPLPGLRFNPYYMEMLQKTQSAELREYLMQHVQQGRTLIKHLDEREHTLYRMAEELVKIQHDFLKDQQGQLVPLTMKQLAERLSLHESTIARAAADKYLTCPRGVLAIRSLFSYRFVSDGGTEVSTNSVKELLQRLIDGEDKQHPLSDEALSLLIQEAGIPCARRTVAKYRKELRIGNTLQRKQYTQDGKKTARSCCQRGDDSVAT